LLALALLASNALALASERTVTGRLVKYAYTSDDNVYREYTLDSNSVSVEMKPFEYLLYTPIHWIDSNYLSYVIESVESSDSTVVAVSTHRPGRSRPVTANEVGVVGDYENIGVGMFALKPGKVTVTVKYATYLSRMGLNYKDERGTPHQTKVFEVTVDSPLEMEVMLKAPGYEKVPNVVIKMEKMFDAMENDVMAYHQIGELMGTGSDLVKGEVTSMGVEQVYPTVSKLLGNVMSKGKLDFRNLLKIMDAVELGVKAYNVLDPIATAWGNFASAVNQVETQLKWQNLKVPTPLPRNMQLEIKMTNTGSEPVEVDKLIAACSGDVSVYHSVAHLYGKARMVSEPFRLAAGETKTFELPVNPAVSYGDANDPYEGRHAYDAWINVGCEYTCDGAESYIERKAEFSAFSYLTHEDMLQLHKAMSTNGAYYQKYFGYRSLPHMFRISCPVEVTVLDARGNEIAVVRSNHENAYAQDNVYAFADGEDKYVLLPRGRLAEYRLRIRALEDGAMDVDALVCANAIRFNGYEQIALKAGDLFEIKLDENQAGEVCRVEESGETVPLEPVAVLNDETYAQLLAKTDVSPWALEAAKQLQYIPMPENMESYRQQLTREEFAGMLVASYEWQNDLVFGSLANDFTGEGKVGASPVIAAADSLGLLPGMAELYAQTSAAQPVTIAEAIGSVMAVLKQNELLSQEQMRQADSVSAGTRLDLLRDWGYLRTEGLVTLKPEDILTAETALAMLWDIEIGQRLGALKQILQEGAYQKSNSALDEAVHTGKAGEPIIGLLKDSDHGLSLNSVLMYTAAADVETVAKESVENRAHGIVAQLQTMSKKWSKYTKGKLPANLKALKQKKGLKPLKAYSGSTSATLKEDGSILFSGLVWFDDKGRMFENAAYVYTGLLFKDKENGEYAFQEALLADQSYAAAYMELYRSDLQWFANKALNVEYPELSKDMKGDEVKTLQEKLKELGYYSGKADGKYSKKVVTAVKKFQKACGLEETGIADQTTQQKLYTWDNVHVMLLDWLNSQYTK